jgi:hypothetical protein
MVTKEEYIQALKDYCDHINNVKKIDNAMDRIKAANEYWKQNEKSGNNTPKIGTNSLYRL